MNPARRILKSAGALVAGYLLSALLTGVTISVLGGLFPESYRPENTGWVVFNVVYGCLYAVAGGYVTAWLAPSRPVAHAILLGSLMAGLAVLTALMVASAPPTPEYASQPGWYYPALAATVLPAIVLGAWMRVRRSGTLKPSGT
jgi:heme A synthase